MTFRKIIGKDVRLYYNYIVSFMSGKMCKMIAILNVKTDDVMRILCSNFICQLFVNDMLIV